MRYISRLLSITFVVVALVSGCTALTGKSGKTPVLLIVARDNLGVSGGILSMTIT